MTIGIKKRRGLTGISGFLFAALFMVSLASDGHAQSTDKSLSDRAKGLDANNNGLVDRDEARGPLAANFDDMDCDKNGGLDGAEIPAFFQGTGCPKAPAKAAAAAPTKFPPLSERAQGLDANKNGLVDRDEARGPLAANFDDIDCDKNGGLDGAEIPGFFQGKDCAKKAPATAAKKPSGGSAAKPASARKRAGGRPPQAVQIDEVTLQATNETYSVTGRVVALQQGPLATRVNGAIDQILVSVGDRVRKGTVIISISKARLEAERRRIAAQVSRFGSMVKNAERELRRMGNLSRSAAYSRARFEDQEGLVAERKAQLTEYGAVLQRVLIDIADASIKAPYDAIVLEKHVEVGGYVNVGAPVVTLLNEKALEIEVDVATFRMNDLTKGTAATIVGDDGKRYPAKVKSIIPNDDTRTRTRPVRLIADFGADAVRFAHNQSVSVQLPLSSGSQILTVHKDAVVGRANGSVVFIVKGNNATMRNIKIGRGIGNKFEVLDGLKAGDKVVIRGNERLGAGAAVRVLN